MSGPESTAPSTDSVPVTALKGVGPAMAERLSRLEILTVQDLLFHLPLRYQDRTRVVPLGALRAGMAATVQGEVQYSEIKFGRRRMLLCTLSDGTGILVLRFFHFGGAQKAALTKGRRLRCFGEVRQGVNTLEMVHPEYRSLEPSDEAPPVEPYLTPVYRTTEGVHQQTLRSLVTQALSLMERDGIREWLPEEVRLEFDLPPLQEALRFLHRPPPDASLERLEAGDHPARRRLAFEELLAHHLSLRKLRASMQRHPAPPFDGDGDLRQRFLSRLPFSLTAAQRRVAEEIGRDLARPHPMQRLVQGDVGSGKTVVAVLAALQAVENGFQAAVMAPTELLAEQHYANFRQWLTPLGLEVAWLSGQLKPAERKEVLARLADGSARLAVGTHALFQEAVRFHRLGLVIIDEQHRFGVHQRLALREKGSGEDGHPHQLIMTATPIPRTLAMTAYADLDVSVIDELPPGRTPVTTVVVPDSRREEVIERVGRACREGRQAYWVCTLVEESEVLTAQAAEDTAALLAGKLPDLTVGLIHGRMKPQEREPVMRAFKAGEIDLLVATTVIEVGVDVPNASLMIIENPERLGLAQLHQLRGRVGRGSHESSCVLMYHGALSEAAHQRLAVLRESCDGFVIAQRDLELRGPGELLGTRQTGMLRFRIADLQRDRGLLAGVARAAARILADHPRHVAPLVERWIGERSQYGGV